MYMTKKVDGLSAIKKESADDRKKFEEGYDLIFNKKKKCKKKTGKSNS